MVRLQLRRLATLGAIACAVLGAAGTTWAATVPHAAIVRGDRPIDLVAVAQSFAAQYRLALDRVVAADIDRDGDVDVVAATDCGLLVWVNDGTGRLTSREPERGPHASGDGPANTLQQGNESGRDGIPNDAPVSRLSAVRAPTHLATVSRAAIACDPQQLFDYTCGTSAPRAPPLATLFQSSRTV